MLLLVTPDLDLDHQVCFALYAASRAVQKAYRSALANLDLTYPQYLVLLVLWQRDGQSVRDLGARLHLDSGTLSPLLRRMEDRGVITRDRDSADGREVTVHLTDEGRALKQNAGDIQRCLYAEVPLSPDELITLRDLARRLVARTEEQATAHPRGGTAEPGVPGSPPRSPRETPTTPAPRQGE